MQVVFNANYLHDGLTILFSSNFLQPWLNIYPMTGTILPGEINIISANFNSQDLIEGAYTGVVNIFSNDPDDMMIGLPVTLNVSSSCGDIGDLNGDADISILDIIAMVNCVLYSQCTECADLNIDSLVNIQDIIMLVNIILYE